MVYLPTFTIKNLSNLGKYTVRPMDPMGLGQKQKNTKKNTLQHLGSLPYIHGNLRGPPQGHPPPRNKALIRPY